MKLTKGILNTILRLVTILFSSVTFSQNTPEKLVNSIQNTTIATDKMLAYNTDDRFYGELIPTVQIAKWKKGYIVGYTTFERKSRFFFTDSNFVKKSSEREISNRILFQIVTDNNEIAFLTGNRFVDENNEVSSHFIYFTKVSEEGKVILEKEIIGTNNLEKPLETVLDDWGNFNMKWTGKMYMLFFPIQHNFAEPGEKIDIHQGSCAYMIKSDGTLYSFFDWNNSHSFEHRMLMTDKHVVLLNKGDASPRGLGVEWYPINEFYLEKIEDEPEEKDLGHPSIEYYYMYDDNEEYSCDAFIASGKNGDNYVPFSIGGAVALKDQSVLVSYSFKNNKPTYDIGITRVRPQEVDCSSGHIAITNTPKVCEHSTRMVKLSDDNILIMWKEFSTVSIDQIIDKLSDAYEDEDTEEELIFTRHNPDKNKIAIINSNGDFIVTPQLVDKTKVDWYYNICLKESNTAWHDTMESFADHMLSEAFKTWEGNVAWACHEHKSKSINVYAYKRL